MDWINEARFFAAASANTRTRVFALFRRNLLEIDAHAVDEVGDFLEFNEITPKHESCSPKNVRAIIRSVLKDDPRSDPIDAKTLEVEEIIIGINKYYRGISVPVVEIDCGQKTNHISYTSNDEGFTERRKLMPPQNPRKPLMPPAPSRRRPIDSTTIFPEDPVETGKAVDRFLVLEQKIREILSHVAPHESNLTAFGFEIENIHSLLCMECEGNWKVMLRNISIDKKGNIELYRRFLDHFKAGEWEAEIAQFGSRLTLKPFSFVPEPGSMEWYTKYSNAKHDRLSQPVSARLSDALDAAAALLITLKMRGILFSSQIFSISSKSKFALGERVFITSKERSTPAHAHSL